MKAFVILSALLLCVGVCCCFAAGTGAPASGPFLGDAKYTVHLDGMLTDVLPQLAKITGRAISLAPPPKGEEPAKGPGKGGTPVTLSFDGSTLDQILMSLCRQVGLVYRVNYGNGVELVEGDPALDPRPATQVGDYTVRLTGCSVRNSRGYSLTWGKPFPETPDTTGALQIQLDIVPRTLAAAQALAGIGTTYSATTDTGATLPAARGARGGGVTTYGEPGMDTVPWMGGNPPVIEQFFRGGGADGAIRLEMRQDVAGPMVFAVPAAPAVPLPELGQPIEPVPLPPGAPQMVAPPQPGAALGAPPNRRMALTTRYLGSASPGGRDGAGNMSVTLSLAAPGHDAKRLAKLEGQLRLRGDVQKTEVTIKPDSVGQVITEGDTNVTVQTWKQDGDTTKVGVEIAMPPSLAPADDGVRLRGNARFAGDSITSALVAADGQKREGMQAESSYDGKLRRITFQFSPPMALMGMRNADATAKPFAADHMVLTITRTVGAEKLLPFVLTDIALP